MTNQRNVNPYDGWTWHDSPATSHKGKPMPLIPDTQAPPRRQLLIAIEGIDGSGKTTLAKSLGAALDGLSHDALVTREPFTDQYRERVNAGDVIASTADRAVHAHWLRTRCANFSAIITDRYYLSCAAYARDCNRTKVLLQQQATFPRPDLWIILDCPMAVAQSRVEARGETFDRDRMQHVRAFMLSMVDASFGGLGIKEPVLWLSGASAETNARAALGAVLSLFKET